MRRIAFKNLLLELVACGIRDVATAEGIVKQYGIQPELKPENEQFKAVCRFLGCSYYPDIESTAQDWGWSDVDDIAQLATHATPMNSTRTLLVVQNWEGDVHVYSYNNGTVDETDTFMAGTAMVTMIEES